MLISCSLTFSAANDGQVQGKERKSGKRKRCTSAKPSTAWPRRPRPRAGCRPGRMRGGEHLWMKVSLRFLDLLMVAW